MTGKKPRRTGRLGEVAAELERDDEPALVEHVRKPVVVPAAVGKRRRTLPAAAPHEPWARFENGRTET